MSTISVTFKYEIGSEHHWLENGKICKSKINSRVFTQSSIEEFGERYKHPDSVSYCLATGKLVLEQDVKPTRQSLVDSL